MCLERFGMRWWLGSALAAACSLTHAVTLSDQPWSAQSWGRVPVQVKADVTADCAAPGAKSGFVFSKSRTDDGDAELIIPSVLKPGVTYELTVPMRAEKAGATVGVDVYFRRDAPYYETTAIKTVRATGQWQTVTLRGTHDSAKVGSVRIALRQDGTAICLGRPSLREIEPTLVAPDDRLHPVSRNFFGIHLNKLGWHNNWPSFEPDVVRMWATGTQWSEMQPRPGEIDWRTNIHAQRLDYFVKHTARHGRDARILMTLAMTPPWATPARADGGACETSPFGKRTCLAPNSMAAWRDFVRELALRYKGRIKLWEVWNEADVPTHWVGGAAAMVEMVRIAAEETKKVDPGSKIIGPNVTSLGLRFLNDFLALGGGRYIDGVSIHFYIGGAPWSVFSRTRNTMELIRSHGLDLPIWNTETNTACGGGVDADVVIQQNLCSIAAVPAIAQAVIGSAALGVENFSYYTWEGAEMEQGGTGLVERSNYRSLTSAGVLYEHLAGLLRGASLKFLPPSQPGLTRAQMVKGGKTCVLAWTDGRALTVSATALLQPGSVRTLDGRKLDSKGADGWRVSEMPVLACGA